MVSSNLVVNRHPFYVHADRIALDLWVMFRKPPYWFAFHERSAGQKMCACAIRHESFCRLVVNWHCPAPYLIGDPSGCAEAKIIPAIGDVCRRHLVH
jgi:hypothetical protein